MILHRGCTRRTARIAGHRSLSAEMTSANVEEVESGVLHQGNGETHVALLLLEGGPAGLAREADTELLLEPALYDLKPSM